MKYLLYSLRLNGWLTPAGTYDSEHTNAAQFSYEGALEKTQRHAENGKLILVMVSLESITETLK